jgi:Outer membrane protein beta-barrel domain
MTKLFSKLSFLFIFTITSSLTINAQEHGHKHYVRAGFQSSQLVDNGTNYFSNSSSGFFVAVMKQKTFAGILNGEIGLQYHQGGSMQNDNNFVKLGYIGIPANLGIKLGPVKAYGGAMAAVKIHTEAKLLGVANIPENSEFNGFDATAYLGVSLKILFLGVDVQYHWGLVDVIGNYRSNFLQIGANLYF